MARRKVVHDALHFMRTNRLAIKFQVMLFITFAHIHHPHKKYYERIYSTSQRRKGSKSGGLGYKSNSYNAVQESDCQQSTSKLSEEASKINQQPEVRVNMFEIADGSSEWDWRGLPEQWLLLSLYEFISNSWMIYASLRTMFGGILNPLLDWLIGSWVGIPAHCLLMGRFVLHPKVDHLCPLVFSSFHLIWRSVQRFADRHYMLGPLTFLLQSEHDLGKFLNLIETNKSGNYLTASSEPPSIDSEDVSASEVPILYRWERYNEFMGRPLQKQNGPVDQEAKRDEEVGPHEHFLRHLMCYEVDSKQGVHYKLRPNRTLEARNKLAASMTNFCLLSVASLAALGIPITLVILLIVLSDFHYVQIYPGCFAKLDKQFAEGKLSFWSHTLEQHHLVAIFFDTLENAIIWLDSGFALTFVVALTYFLNYDILFYWRHLNQRLEETTRRVRSHFELRQEANCARQSASGLCRSPLKRLADVEAAKLSALINEIQFEIYDFFMQVERADHIVSDILTTAILVWLFSCAILSYFFLTRMEAEMPLILKMVQILGLLVITLATNYLLTLHRCCKRSYKLICTLMAHEQGHKTKRQFIKVLDFFFERKRTAYTLFQHYPYLATTYIALIGWSLSCFAVAFGLFGHGQFKSEAGILERHRYFDF